MAYIKGTDRRQTTLFPESIDDYVCEDNPVRVIEAFVENLDIVALEFKRAQTAPVGRPPYDPRDLLKLYLYGYLNRIRSSRKLESEAARNLEVIWLLSSLKPDFKTIADFRRDNKEALRRVFKQFSLLCKEWGLFAQTLVAIDGSKFKANNSKKNNYNRKKLKRHLKYIDEKINDYLHELEEGDQREEDIHKPTAQEIAEHIEQLKNRKLDYEEKLNAIEKSDVKEISTTDPDSRQMAVNNNGTDICYNVQTVVDGEHCLVIDYDVINNPTDHSQLSNMAKRGQAVLKAKELHVLADKGYYSAPELKSCEELGFKTYVTKQKFAGRTKDKEFYQAKFSYDKEHDRYICPAGQALYPGRYRKHEGKIIGRDYLNYKACKACDVKDRCTKGKRGRTVYRNNDQDLLDKIDQRTREDKELYNRRQMIVEHPFGTIKRNWGFSYFLTRGLQSVSAESGLAFLAYNMKRAINIMGVREMVKRLQEA